MQAAGIPTQVGAHILLWMHNMSEYWALQHKCHSQGCINYFISCHELMMQCSQCHIPFQMMFSEQWASFTTCPGHWSFVYGSTRHEIFKYFGVFFSVLNVSDVRLVFHGAWLWEIYRYLPQSRRVISLLLNCCFFSENLSLIAVEESQN